MMVKKGPRIVVEGSALICQRNADLVTYLARNHKYGVNSTVTNHSTIMEIVRGFTGNLQTGSATLERTRRSFPGANEAEASPSTKE